jgi:hypothetical protein
MPPWEVDELPAPPRLKFDVRRLVGPGLMMAGAAIGGGEWLMGPAVTAKFGGVVMWIATVSILLQCGYNLEVMRYTLYCGEPIFVGFFRMFPGPGFWTVAYLLFDFGALWPYLSANAAVPLAAAFLGHLPGGIPTNYKIPQLVTATGLSTVVAEEVLQSPERFGPRTDVRKDTGLPDDVLREMAEYPERFGNTEMWKPFPRPLNNHPSEDTIDETVTATGLSPDVIRAVAKHPARYGTVEQVVAAVRTDRPLEADSRCSRSRVYRS